MADFATRLALRDHLLSQIRVMNGLGPGPAPVAAPRPQQPEAAKCPPPPKRTILPESCATKLYESAIALKNKALPDALAKAFQALAICDFTVGPFSPQSMVILEHIATICDAQGDQLGADMMRSSTFSILFRGRLAPKGKLGH